MTPFSLNIRGRFVGFDKPAVMGIINATPDSFHAESRAQTYDAVCQMAQKHIDEGADIIDLGAYSTRPGSSDVPVNEEIERLALAMQAIREVSKDIPVSIDTFRAEVAHIAITGFDADIINDISGGSIDPEMLPTVAKLKCPYIAMHMRGNPSDMQTHTNYRDVTADVLRELSAVVNRCSLLGINDVIVDPGFGFAKTTEQNYQLMANLRTITALNRPILVGISRKSMLTKPLGIKASEAINATTALNMFALENGASILRVHDVWAANQAVIIHENLHPHAGFWN